ncbi:MAG: hypothetical protein EAX86_05165 [Candidatus Heimdallarchaeota archaeon]|nr:hypothetical protein [Candidatus Heimdallarchaeota archaeon]
MNYRKISPRIIAIFGILAIIPLLIATIIGFHLINQTSNQATEIAKDQAFSAAQSELKYRVYAETGILETYFASYNSEILNLRCFVQNLLLSPIEDDRWTLIKQFPGGAWGLSSDVGIGDIFIPSFVSLNNTVNQTLSVFSSIGIYFSSFVNSPSVYQVYLGTEVGVNRFFPYVNLTEITPSSEFDSRQRPWYIGAKEKNGTFWSIYTDALANRLVATLSIPFFNNSDFFGVLGIDLSFESISERISAIEYKNSGYAILIDPSLNILVKSNITSIHRGYDELIQAENLSSINNTDLLDKLDYIIENPQGNFTAMLLTTNGEIKEKLIVFQHIKDPNMILTIVVEKAEIAEIAQDLAEIWEQSAGQYLLTNGLIFIVFILIVFIAAFGIFGVAVLRYSPPIEQLLSEKRRADILFNIIGHDLRNALQGHFFAIELQESKKDPQFLNTTYKKIEKISHLIHQIGELRFLTSDSVKENLMDLESLMKEVVKQINIDYILKENEEKDIILRNTLSKPIKVRYNPILQSSFVEIGLNALIYNATIKKELVIELEERTPNFVHISFSDNGLGIQEEMREILQDPLQNLDIRTGLGYVMLNLAVEFSQGYYLIEYRDKILKIGTKVEVVLPLA